MNRYFIYAGIAVIILSFLMGMQTCNCYSKRKIAPPDTASVIIKYDSTKVVLDTFYTPSPIKRDTVYRPIYITKFVPVTDSFIAYENQPVDTVAILKDYLATYIYSDPIHLKNGIIVINDTVSKNRIKRGLSINLQDIVTTKEIILKQPKLSIGYVGFDIFGNPKEPLQGGGISLAFKNKKEHFYGAGIDFLKGSTPLYRLITFIPLRFSDKNK